jgi:hypothetical protein
MMETIRIRKMGYPIRFPAKEFFARYHVLMPYTGTKAVAVRLRLSLSSRNRMSCCLARHGRAYQQSLFHCVRRRTRSPAA